MSFNWAEILVLVSFSIQSCYWLFVFTLPLRVKKTPHTSLEHQGISVIVCAHNEYESLQKLIPALLSQTYPLFEIIIVNDRSTDNTALLETTFTAEKIKFIHLTTTAKGFNSKKYALTRGIESASYTYVAVTDADCLPASNHWIEKMYNSLPCDQGIVLGLSPYFKVQGNWLLHQVIQFETTYTALQLASFALANMPYMGLGRNMLYHKDLFRQSTISTTDKHLVGGDDDLFVNKIATKTNTGVCFDSDSFVYSYPKKTFRAWFHQKWRHLSVSSHYSTKSKLILGLLNTSHLFFYVGFMAAMWCTPFNPYIILIYVLRTCLLFAIFDKVSRNLKGQINRISIPLLDMVYPFYLFTIGAFSIVFKKTTWK